MKTLLILHPSAGGERQSNDNPDEISQVHNVGFTLSDAEYGASDKTIRKWGAATATNTSHADKALCHHSKPATGRASSAR